MRIAFCGHSHHRTTGSSAFLLDLLRARAEIVDFWYDGWLTGEPFDAAPLTAANIDAVVVWQVESVAQQLALAELPNVTFFPMYDGCHAMPDSYWRSLQSIKVVCFSSTLHSRLQRLGLRSRFVRYAPDPERFGRVGADPELAGYFWQRQQDVTWRTIRPLLGDARFRRFTLHRALDPSFGDFVAPSEEDVERYAVRTTEWFPTRAEAAADLARHNVYFAPRLREGIGMSFLEAMAMGFLVVAPDHPTMSEYIASGVNGLLYDPARPRPLDLSRHAELGARARRTVAQASRRWERSIPALLDFLFIPTAEHPVVARFDAFDPLAIEPPATGSTTAVSGTRAPPADAPLPAGRPRGSLEGGRRLRTEPRADAGPAPLVTVAVVTRNAEATLPPTLDSVLRQDWPSLEVVVLDGASEDGTVDFLRRHGDAIDYWRSAPDGGPYEAMNAAVQVARGKYVLFMNAGDTFHATDALSAALEGAPANADVIFGHHVYRHVDGHDELHLAADFADTWSRLREGRIGWGWLAGVPGHQATLTRTEWLRANGYRTSLRIAADHDALYRLARAGGKFHHSMAILATYVGGGLSWRNQKRCLDEWRQLALEYSGDPAAVTEVFETMRADMQREELPRLSTRQLLLRLGRVRGATRELRGRVKRGIRERLARLDGRPAPVRVALGGSTLPAGVRRLEGLSRGESWGRWTDGHRVVVELAAAVPRPRRVTILIDQVFGPNVGKTLVIRIGAHTYTHALTRGEQRCRVSLDDSTVADVERIELDIPAPASPQQFGYGADERLLGVALRSLYIESRRE